MCVIQRAYDSIRRAERARLALLIYNVYNCMYYLIFDSLDSNKLQQKFHNELYLISRSSTISGCSDVDGDILYVIDYFVWTDCE